MMEVEGAITRRPNNVEMLGFIEKMFEQAFQPVTIRNGFRAAGICPFNPDAIDISKLLPSELTNRAIQAATIDEPPATIALGVHALVSALMGNVIDTIAGKVIQNYL
jgi:hypothetical protein